MAQSTDTATWQHAVDNGSTIVTKDSDSCHRIIHVRVCNQAQHRPVSLWLA
jgi:predicted nuclease of predicted toxin-antitoxin system